MYSHTPRRQLLPCIAQVEFDRHLAAPKGQHAVLQSEQEHVMVAIKAARTWKECVDATRLQFKETAWSES